MVLARSKITSQGQISIPAKVRKRLGVEPGSIIEWDEEGDKVVVKRSAAYTSEDLHKAIFSEVPQRKNLDELKEGIRTYIRTHHEGR